MFNIDVFGIEDIETITLYLLCFTHGKDGKYK